MPLYDCVLLFNPQVRKDALIELIVRIGKHVCSRSGVITDIKSFGTIQLGYGIKKRDGRFFQGQLMQLSMMATPNMNKELHYLNKEDRLLRWLLVKQRNTKYGFEFLTEEDERSKFDKFFSKNTFGDDDDDDDDDGVDDDETYKTDSVDQPKNEKQPRA